MQNQAVEGKEEDFKYIKLILHRPAIYDCLGVFVRDPVFRDMYWFQKIRVCKSPDKIGDICAKIEVLDVGILDSIPAQASYLDEYIAESILGEEGFGMSDNPDIRELQGSVGVAEYTGPDMLTLENIVLLVGLRYYQLRNVQSS